MPRYFFDIHDGIHVKDAIGRDLPGIEAARIEAMRMAAEFTVRPRMLSEDGGAVVIVIRDRGDAIVGTIRLVFTIEAG